jgi:hypothetical protein
VWRGGKTHNWIDHQKKNLRAAFEGRRRNRRRRIGIMKHVYDRVRLLPAAVLVLILAMAVASMSLPKRVSAQTSSSTCSASAALFAAACDTTNLNVTRCCTVYRVQLYTYPDCYCGANVTAALQLASACGFVVPTNLTSCYS